jgi:hypothetical protein
MCVDGSLQKKNGEKQQINTQAPQIGKSGTRYYDDESNIFQLILDIFCAAREVVTQALFSSFEFCAA